MINIIGGSGFIGNELSNNLKKSKLDFKIVDIQRPTDLFAGNFVEGDITSLENLESSIDNDSIIINLSAEHKDNVVPVSKYYDVNVEGARNLCKVAVQKNVKKIIFTSSVAVYGFNERAVDETGELNPFNHYGKSKLEAERVYQDWYEEDPINRTLVIIRPTAVFGFGNRGNVFNLLNQIQSKKFLMIGSGNNRKSIAYVKNVAEFLMFSLGFDKGLYHYNYIDKPDLTMNQLFILTKNILGHENPIQNVGLRVPYRLALLIGYILDFLSLILKKDLIISSIRIKKFCANSVFNSSINKTGFIPSKTIHEGLEETIKAEFLNKN